MTLNLRNHYKRGTNPNSRRKRQSQIDDSFFSTPNVLNCYWAGFIAADGYICKDSRYLTIALARKDRKHIQTFLDNTKSNYTICDGIARKKYPYSYITILSPSICNDLKKHWNIVNAKSLILSPPTVKDKELVDAFIIGYIDGDGSIGLYPRKRQLGLQIQVMGTKQVLSWIGSRFSQIDNKIVKSPYLKKGTKIHFQCITDRRARKIFEHYYNVQVPKLERKWTKDIHNHCLSFQKYRNIEKYREILRLSSQGKTDRDIATFLDVTIQAIFWYKHSNLYGRLEGETKALDAGEVDIETQETVNDQEINSQS